VFIGEYRHNIDTKGRLSIPAKLRNQCGDTVYVVRGNDGCLSLYTQEGWEQRYEEIRALSKKKKKNRMYTRLLTSGANECEFDKLGRINIPSNLRKDAELIKECVIIGVGDYIEIWSEKHWDDYYEENKDKFDEVSEEIDEE